MLAKQFRAPSPWLETRVCVRARAHAPQVLPPLLQELRTAELVPIILPIVLKILPQQDGAEFVEASLPALRCVVCVRAQGRV